MRLRKWRLCWQQRQGIRERHHFDRLHQFRRDVAKRPGQDAALPYLRQNVAAEHPPPVSEFSPDRNVARVAMLGLHLVESDGDLIGIDEGEVFAVRPGYRQF